MKIIFILMFSLFLYAQDSFFSKDYTEINNLKKKITNQKIDFIYQDFTRVTGESKNNYQAYKNYDDKDWLKGIDYFYYKVKKTPIKYNDISIGSRMKMISSLPMLKESLESLYKSSQGGNILSSYLGERIMSMNFFMANPKLININKEIKDMVLKYYPAFIKPLKSKKYCYAYLNDIVFKESNLISLPHDQIFKLVEYSYSECKDNKDIPFYIGNNLKQRIVKHEGFQKYITLLKKKRVEKEKKLQKQKEEFIKNLNNKQKSKDKNKIIKGVIN